MVGDVDFPTCINVGRHCCAKIALHSRKVVANRRLSDIKNKKLLLYSTLFMLSYWKQKILQTGEAKFCLISNRL